MLLAVPMLAQVTSIPPRKQILDLSKRVLWNLAIPILVHLMNLSPWFVDC